MEFRVGSSECAGLVVRPRSTDGVSCQTHWVTTKKVMESGPERPMVFDVDTAGSVNVSVSLLAIALIFITEVDRVSPGDSLVMSLPVMSSSTTVQVPQLLAAGSNGTSRALSGETAVANCVGAWRP